MNFFTIVVLLFAVTGITIAEEEIQQPPNKLNMQQVEELLKQIEQDEKKLKPSVENDPTLSVALQQLFAQFRQLTGAYVNVLNAVNKQLGLPKYPKLPGLTRRRRGIRDSAPFKQIVENVEQLGSTISEVGQLLTRSVSTVADDSRRTILKQFQQFTDLWSNQLNEIARMFDPSMTMYSVDEGLQGRDNDSYINQIQRQVQQLTRDVQRYVNNFVSDLRNRANHIRNQIFPQ